MLRHLLAVGTALFAAAPALPADPINVSAYPELAPEAVLPPIVASLRTVLKDPHSIQDFTLCRPVSVKVRDGRPVKWVVPFSLNARNSYGGFAGVETYGAVFRPGKPLNVSRIGAETNAGLDKLINDAVAKIMVDCRRVPDERVRALLDGSS